MPYIADRFKSFLDTKAVMEVGDLCTTPGELNYVLTTIVKEYFARTDKCNYQAINDILGALEGAKLEFYRRVVADYENIKIKENGDVY